MPRSIVALSFSLLVGCGGATQTDLFSDASTGTDGGTGTDGSATDGGTTVDARTDARPGDCQNLIGKVNDLRNNAVKCEPLSPTPACGLQVEDLCCPLTVTGPATTKDIADFLAAVKAAKAANCPMGCTPVPCASKPTLKCVNGGCQQF